MSRSRHRQPKASQKNTSKSNASFLRIIGGEWRSRKLAFHDAEGLRPTTDRVRETLFNWLSADIYDARCLDCFAGSGALGFEALSRGAAYVQFFERNKTTVNQIKENLRTLNTQKGCIDQGDALSLLANPPKAPFDIIFLDPPFHQSLIAPCCELLVKQQWLAPSALIYVEAESGLSMGMIPANWQLLKEKTAGQVAFRLYEAVAE